MSAPVPTPGAGGSPLLPSDVLHIRHGRDDDGRWEVEVMWGAKQMSLAIHLLRPEAERLAWQQAAERFLALAIVAEGGTLL